MPDQKFGDFAALALKVPGLVLAALFVLIDLLLFCGTCFFVVGFLAGL